MHMLLLRPSLEHTSLEDIVISEFSFPLLIRSSSFATKVEN